MEIRKFRSKNPVHKSADFDVHNALKFTYKHLYFQTFSVGDTPKPSLNEEGKREKNGKGKKEKEKKRKKKSRQKTEKRGIGKKGRKTMVKGKTGEKEKNRKGGLRFHISGFGATCTYVRSCWVWGRDRRVGRWWDNRRSRPHHRALSSRPTVPPPPSEYPPQTDHTQPVRPHQSSYTYNTVIDAADSRNSKLTVLYDIFRIARWNS